MMFRCFITEQASLLLWLHMEKHFGNDKRGASVIDIYTAVPGLPLREEVETDLVMQIQFVRNLDSCSDVGSGKPDCFYFDPRHYLLEKLHLKSMQHWESITVYLNVIRDEGRQIRIC